MPAPARISPRRWGSGRGARNRPLDCNLRFTNWRSCSLGASPGALVVRWRCEPVKHDTVHAPARRCSARARSKPSPRGRRARAAHGGQDHTSSVRRGRVGARCAGLGVAWRADARGRRRSAPRSRAATAARAWEDRAPARSETRMRWRSKMKSSCTVGTVRSGFRPAASWRDMQGEMRRDMADSSGFGYEFASFASTLVAEDK